MAESDPSAGPSSVDGFHPDDAQPYMSFDPDTAGRFYEYVERAAELLGVEFEGLERIPEGRVLLVGNHGFGWDVVFLMARIWSSSGRTVWALGEHAWWKWPFVRKVAAAVGTVDGTPANVDTLLERDELVLVLPGGLREAVKPRDLRYRLLWGHRYGFVRAAIRNQAPIVPVACIGGDDLFDLVGNAFGRGERWLGRSGFPLPLPRRLLPLPHLVRFRFVVGEPVPSPPARALENERWVKRFRREIEGELHELIELQLARRAGIDLR